MTEIEHTMRCNKLADQEDLQFTADMLAYNVGRRRYKCVTGHSVYIDVPLDKAPEVYPDDAPIPTKSCLTCLGPLPTGYGRARHTGCIKPVEVFESVRACADCGVRIDVTKSLGPVRRFCGTCKDARRTAAVQRWREKQQRSRAAVKA